jgi:phosphoglucomutase
VTDPDRLDSAPEDILAPIRDAALSLSDLPAITGRSAPDVIT